jgi:hypothetical protein
MSAMERHGIVPVARIDDLSTLEATLICCLRLFYEGDGARDALERSVAEHLGPDRGAAFFARFADLCETLRRHARRPLRRRHAGCGAAGADESAFAAMISAAATGEREDAMLIAVCIVRADVAPCVVALAEQVGLGLGPLVTAVVARNARRLH